MFTTICVCRKIAISRKGPELSVPLCEHYNGDIADRFIPLARSAFLFLSKQQRLRGWLETSSAARPLTRRFVAGVHLEDALNVARKLASASMKSSLDHLGENVTTTAEARSARNAYLEALAGIEEAKLGSTISVKVTALGLDISPAECLSNAELLVKRAAEAGTRVEFDMESTAYTGRTLDAVRELHSRYGSVRAVIQAYLFRSAQDIEQLCRDGIPVRLCKGAYQEPPEAAYQTKAEVDRNYVQLLRTLFESGTDPAIATHDSNMIAAAQQAARDFQVPPERFEFQMLYGVRSNLQAEVAGAGYRLRIYVPYGEAWYPYFMRRLAEKPANALLIARSLFT